MSDALASGVPVTAAAAPEAFWQSPVGAPLAGALASGGAILYAASPAVLQAASPVKAPTGIVAIARWQPADVGAVLAAQPALIVCAVHVQDPGNIGAIIRAADAAGATGVIATGRVGGPVRLEGPPGIDGERVPAAGRRGRPGGRRLPGSPGAGRASGLDVALRRAIASRR